jgi:hypothetical protein
VRREFDCLRHRLEVLGERSFLHAVLVRLVKHFWDDENLRIIEAGSRAAREFLQEQERSLAQGAARDAPPPAERLRSARKPVRP